MAAVFLLRLLPVLSAPADENLRSKQFLIEAKKGFTALYSIEHKQSLAIFSRMEREFPAHPGPPLYEGVSIWLRELYQRQDLDLDHFVNPGYFARETKQKMDPAQRTAFFSALEKSQKLSEAILRKDPQNRDARYFMGAAYGILAAFAFTVDHSTREAFSKGKKAYKIDKELIQEDPDYYDAYMTVGMYEYIVGSLPWYIKWLATLVGYHGSKEQGFKYLTLAAEKGQFVTDDARTLEMVLYVFEKQYPQALREATYLRDEYPENFLFHINQAQILEKMGDRQRALQDYREILKWAEQGRPNYQKLPLSTFRYTVAGKFMDLGDLESALKEYRRSVQSSGTPSREKVLSVLGAGKVLDLLGKRREAVSEYQAVLKLENVDDAHKLARKYLEKPFQG